MTTGASSARAPLWHVLVLAGIGLLTFFWVFSQLGASLDLSDEGFYLHSAIYRRLYPQNFTLFGFVYGPLGQLVGWDLVAYRRLGVLISAGLAIWLGCRIGLWLGLGILRSIMLGLAASAWPFLLFHLWLPTPSYNALALQSLLLIAIGLVPRDAQNPQIALWQGVVIGLGGWLAFMAKPTTALIAGIVVLVFLLVTQPRKIRAIVVPVVMAAIMMIAAAYYVDGGITNFIAHLQRGVAHAALLDAGHSVWSLLRLDAFSMRAVEWLVLLISCVLVCALTLATKATPPAFLGLWLALSAALVVAVILGVGYGSVEYTSSVPLVVLGIPLGAAIAAVIANRHNGFWTTMRPVLPLVLALAVFPYALAFGTNNIIWYHSALAGAFWLFAALPLVGRIKSQGAILPAVSIAQILVAGLLSISMANPYRQLEPLRDQVQVVQVGPAQSPVVVSSDVARYLAGLKEIAASAGLAAHDPVIDITGRMPGALFALDATPIGDPWIVGGYPGSAVMARSALAAVSCDILARAWVLSEPTGIRALAMAEVLPPAFSFIEVGTVDSPVGEYNTRFPQILLRPTGDIADRLSACEQWKAEAIVQPAL